jgi:hypothetical protein
VSNRFYVTLGHLYVKSPTALQRFLPIAAINATACGEP